MRRKKRKIKYRSFVLLLGIMIIPLILIVSNSKEEKKEIVTKDVIDSYVGKNIDELESFLQDKNMSIKKDYQYSKEYDENKIIHTELKDKMVNVLISKGIIDDKTYRDKKVDELGKVPIMMYHGIVDTTDNKYTGGNVDKDGYNRTSNAFMKDLEFYYEKGYRMIRLSDYVQGIIDVPLGLSPIILTFDDGNKNNFHVLGRNSDGTLQIDPNCAVGVMETFKKNHPDATVTATFFLMNNLFNQKEYDEEIMHWLVEHGYDIGNHTTIHADFTSINTTKTQEVVGKQYQTLERILKDKYVKIIALPFGSPYKKSHANYPYILKGTYDGVSYETEAALRVGWEPEVSPFNKDFDKTFLKRVRAYDNNGKEFDIEMCFKNLEKNRFISDGDKDMITIPKKSNSKLNTNYTNVYVYSEE